MAARLRAADEIALRIAWMLLLHPKENNGEMVDEASD